MNTADLIRVRLGLGLDSGIGLGFELDLELFAVTSAVINLCHKSLLQSAPCSGTATSANVTNFMKGSLS